ncbi:MAG: cell division ATP-binding protein FtsE [Cyanobacteriota bacterium]|nr:cell division ATP-binding protein FtsE [Cyanobacteriota bacterium]
MRYPHPSLSLPSQLASTASLHDYRDPDTGWGEHSSPLSLTAQPEQPAPLVSLTGVSKVFPNGVRVLDEIDLQVYPGDFIFVTGVSGAGKSTLLRLLYGAEQATTGQVMVNQISLARIRPRPLALLRRRLGVVFQDYRLLTNRTVAENVAFVLRAQGMSPGEIRRRLGPTLKMVGLTEKRDRFPHELSGGEQQRLSLARAIVCTPILLLADEPTGNLDRENSLLVLQILERLNSFGVTIMMTSHDPYLMERTQHRVIRIEAGHLYDVR